ncbi:MAG: GTP 3',8-cyclase MoaA [Spirochaetes bacterium]|nr:GTP 3',8-cyclase MoaA [Spirochaetota bacterium]
MLTDSYLRKHDYLRVSITDHCNLRCAYCMPPEGVALLSHDQVLRNEEFIRLIGIFVSLGVVKVRFTGGEPLLRKGFVDIAAKTREMFPALELCLTTNGTLLGDFIGDLKDHGVRKLNISLDTLSRDRYRSITRRDCFEDVIRNIDRALAESYFDVKINAVLSGDTIAELDDFLEYFKERNVTLRFIERMPFTAEPHGGSFLPSDRFIEELAARGDLDRNRAIDTSVALMYNFMYRGRYPVRIGVIPPVSKKFCGSCNRLRLTSDGSLKTCLHSGADHALKELLRSGADDAAVAREILAAVKQKHEGHSLDCASDEGGCAALVSTGFMSKIGG